MKRNHLFALLVLTIVGAPRIEAGDTTGDS
jgi:hypothetical protein